MNNDQYRQGDVFFIKIDKLPIGVKKAKSTVLVYGESSGHSHRLVAGDVFKKGNEMFLVLNKASDVVHEEHKSIRLPKGLYAVVRQREYLSSDMTRIVID